jgi:hypothetical protein
MSYSQAIETLNTKYGIHESYVQICLDSIEKTQNNFMSITKDDRIEPILGRSLRFSPRCASTGGSWGYLFEKDPPLPLSREELLWGVETQECYNEDTCDDAFAVDSLAYE